MALHPWDEMGLAGPEATRISAGINDSLQGLEGNQSWLEDPTRGYKLKPIMPLKINCQNWVRNKTSIIGLDENFLNKIQRAQTIKKKINKFTELKFFKLFKQSKQ